MKQLHTEIYIDGPPSLVWNVLMDFERYGEWNPFVLEAQGRATVGSQLMVRLSSGGEKATTFRPTVTVAEENRTFEWLGKFGIRGLFDGRHRFELRPEGSGTRFVQAEEFSGVLVPLLSKMLDGTTKDGFEAMNGAIKLRAEAMAPNEG